MRSLWALGALGVALVVARCTTDGARTPTGAPLMTDDASDVLVVDGGPPHQAYGGSWTPLAQPPYFSPDEMALLTDGTVMVHQSSSPDWWRLSPDAYGSYVGGSWSKLPAMPLGYAPRFFGLAVLPSGKVVALGGEYDRTADAWTSLGAMFDPVALAWTPVLPPFGWSMNTYGIGDTPTVVLADGTLMIGNVDTTQQALFDERTLTFTPTGTGKADNNAEEGWTLLPGGKVLTLDVFTAPKTEIYDPSTGSWSFAGSTPVPVADKIVGEVGPAILMPSGKVFAMGATAHNALYDTASGTWSQGPDFPIATPPDGGDAGQLDMVDGPAALLPNGNVLCVASPAAYAAPATFLEFDGVDLTTLPATANAPMDPSYALMLLPLPSGQVLSVDGSQDVEVFTPGGAPDSSWAPTITSVPTTLARGQTYALSGTQLNGLSQACSYGDDDQCATNYPLVRITNQSSGHVFYARTHDPSSMGVATGGLLVSTLFDVASNTEPGASTLVVVANGIASAPSSVTVQ